MQKQEMVDYIAKCSSATANEADVRRYYSTKNENEVREDFQKLLIGEKQRLTASNEDVRKAEADAQAAIRARDAAYSDMIWSQICNTPITHTSPKFNGKCCDPSTANRIEVSAWPHEGERPNGEWFRRVISEQPFLANRLSWHDYVTPQAEAQQGKENDARTLGIFFDLARRLNISHSQANQASILAAYPDGILDANQLEQDINAGKISLHAAGAAEAEQFNRDLVNFHNQRWQTLTRNKSVGEIKQLSAQERSEREQLTNRITPEPKRHMGAEPLPETITARKIKDASRETIALWRAKYSITSINDRLQGLS